MQAILRRVRWLIAFAVIGFWLWVLGEHATLAPMTYNVPFEAWYGNWKDVFLVSAVFVAFVLGLAWPRGWAQWRNAGMYSAFLISLFVEMFGLPLTLFLLAPLIDVPVLAFGLGESHLLALALDVAGVMPLGWGIYFVMTVSMTLIAIGMALLAIGWAQVFGARHELVTGGIYGVVRHPQYLGLMLVIVAYVRQARREDADLEARFGEAFWRYAAQVPPFIPRFRRRSASAAPADLRA